MPRKSTVKTLPAQIRAEVDRLLADGRYTLDDVVGHLRTMGADVSRSALGRYSQEFEQVAVKMREAREVTTAFAKELGELPDNDMGRVLTELLHTIVFKVLTTQTGADGEVAAQDVMFLARSLKDLSTATRQSAELEMKIRDRVAAETAKRAAGEAEAVGREKGLSAETVEAIKTRILGIRKPARAEG
jgi:HD-GYP domain-containing protein (c-di-GMP phosphodiesterase class II)